jgi:hypothetical protein
MRKGCRAHIRRKVVVRDDAVMALQSSKFAWVKAKGRTSFFRKVLFGVRYK